MATVFKCNMVLHASASPGFSSSKLLASSVSFIPPHRRLPGFKSLKFRPSNTFESLCQGRRAKNLTFEGQDDYQSVLDKRNKVKGQLARSKEEIEKLKENIESAGKNLGEVVSCLNKIEQELGAEIEAKNSTLHEEADHESEHRRHIGFKRGRDGVMKLDH